jgi:hypothetical protein
MAVVGLGGVFKLKNAIKVNKNHSYLKLKSNFLNKPE